MINDSELLALKKLAIGYRLSRKQHKTVAEGISVSLKAGELVCLLGPNGSGKSTLMRTISGMQPPIAGEVLLGGAKIHEISGRDLATQLAVVLTERITVGTLSAYALVSLGRYPHTNWAGTLTEKDHKIIRDSLEVVGATEFSNRNVSELSDGERQKIMVARALAQEPRILILDEITAFLDLPRRVDIMNLLRKMTRDTGKAVLLSTHDLDLALRTADQLWLLSKEGVLQTGAPEDLVLSGDFEKAFSSEGIEFDNSAGYFKLNGGIIGSVKILGTARNAVRWTERAFERQGYLVLSNGGVPDLSVEVIDRGGALFWRLTDYSEETDFGSILALVSHIVKIR